MVKEIQLKEYKSIVTTRFIDAMNQVIAKRVKDCRNDKEFAESVGEYQQNISKIVNGSRFPTLNMIGRLCDTYGVSITWLFFGYGQMFGVPKLDTPIEKRLSNLESKVQNMTVNLKNDHHVLNGRDV